MSALGPALWALHVFIKWLFARSAWPRSRKWRVLCAGLRRAAATAIAVAPSSCDRKRSMESFAKRATTYSQTARGNSSAHSAVPEKRMRRSARCEWTGALCGRAVAACDKCANLHGRVLCVRCWSRDEGFARGCFRCKRRKAREETHWGGSSARHVAVCIRPMVWMNPVHTSHDGTRPSSQFRAVSQACRFCFYLARRKRASSGGRIRKQRSSCIQCTVDYVPGMSHVNLVRARVRKPRPCI